MPKVTQCVRVRDEYLENTLKQQPTFFPPEITGFSFKLLGKQQYGSEKKKKEMLKMVTPAVLITIDTVGYL